MACRFGTTGLSLEDQIHAKLVIVRRSCSVYLMEAAVGTRFYALLGVRFFIWKSPQDGGAFLQRPVAIAAELGIV